MIRLLLANPQLRALFRAFRATRKKSGEIDYESRWEFSLPKEDARDDRLTRNRSPEHHHYYRGNDRTYPHDPGLMKLSGRQSL